MVRNLFLVDDDEDDRTFFLTVIEKIDLSMNCEVAENGKEAIDKLAASESNPDLIFLDLNMPVMNGQQFLAAVKRDVRLKNIPVVILSTSSDTMTVEESKQLGAAYFLTKPAKLSMLEENLRRFFRDLSLGSKYSPA